MKNAIILLLLSLLLVPVMIMAQNQETKIDLSASIPIDPKIITGKLDNGMVYYIRKNDTPKNRAELRLVVNAGSILEDDDQQGLAHFCEHMAFNGTKNFSKHNLVNFLESIGMKFGAELNAYTSFDETVYFLQLPTEKPALLDTGLMILFDWAANVSYEGEEIDKERGVIHEEWRLGTGAQDRMMRQYLPVLYFNSQYSRRLPIGKVDIIDKAPYERLTSFYKDWYRPNLMAVIAIGDFDEKEMEKKIISMFSQLKNPEPQRERKVVTLPSHKKTLVSVVSDKENTNSTITYYVKLEPDTNRNIGYYRESIIEELFTNMLNNRISEKLQEENTPCIYAGSSLSRFTRTKDAYRLYASAKLNRVDESLRLILTEDERVFRYGFTPTELERAKVDMLRSVEKQYKERDKRRSNSIASEYQRNFLSREPIPGIEYEYELYKKLLPGITLTEVNSISKKINAEKSKVVVITLPEKADVKKIAEKEVLDIISQVKKNKDIKPYVDEVSDKPIISKDPMPSKVIAHKAFPELGVTEWTLANGLKVVLKPTDFKNDEILMRAYSFGGTSLYELNDLRNAEFADDVISGSGIADFDNIQLEKKLTGKVAYVYPVISELSEGFYGSASPDDIETLLQLTYLYFTHPRKDEKVFSNYISTQKNNIENRYSSPNAYFSDTITATMYQYNPRKMPLTVADLKNTNLDMMMKIFRERFASANDFTFIFIGNFDTITFKPLIEKYLGGIPSDKETETWIDRGIRDPKGKIEKTVYRGIEPKATVYLSFQGDFDYSYENRINLSAMSDILSIRLRENIREDQGGVYGIRASVSLSKFPWPHYYLSISFGCDPDKADKLIESCFDEIKKLQKDGGEEVNLKKVQETLLRTRETSLRENSFWAGMLQQYYFNNQNLSEFATYESMIKGLTLEKIKNTALKYINLNNYVRVVLMPEKKE